jgi:O-antigen/teichoic acid export membrane protein
VYWKNISKVFTGTVVAQAIPLLASLAIARLFSPQSFGEYSLWLGVSLIISVFITLRLETLIAVVEPGKDRNEAFIATIISIILIASALLTISILMHNINLSFISRFPYNAAYLWIFGGAIIALSGVILSYLSAEGAYSKLTIYRVFLAFTIAFSQIISSIISTESNSLVYSYMGSSFLVAIIYIISLKKIDWKDFKFQTFYLFVIKYKRYPSISLPAGTMNSISAELPVIVITTKYGADIGGAVALTMKVLGAPIGLVGLSILDVFKKYAADDYRNEGNCRSVYIKTLKALTGMSFLVLIGIIFFAESIISLAYGDEWQLSGTIALWLAPLFCMRFIASPLSYVFYISGKLEYDLYWQCGLFVFTLCTFFLLSDYKISLIVYSFGYSFLYLLYLFISYKLSLGQVARQK